MEMQMTVFKFHKLLPVRQSDLRKEYSCATALEDDLDYTRIFTALDDNKISFLIMLDNSKAFDTINY